MFSLSPGLCRLEAKGLRSSRKGALCPSVWGLGSDMPWEFMGQAPSQTGKAFSGK